MITASKFESLVDEGVPYTYTTWQDEVVDSVVAGSDFWSEGEDSDAIKLDDEHTAEFFVGETGGEGSAEHIWQVWKVTDADGNYQYFMKTGYYMSYDGSNWDGDLVEVEPYEKTVTDWKVKK